MAHVWPACGPRAPGRNGRLAQRDPWSLAHVMVGERSGRNLRQDEGLNPGARSKDGEACTLLPSGRRQRQAPCAALKTLGASPHRVTTIADFLRRLTAPYLPGRGVAFVAATAVAYAAGSDRNSCSRATRAGVVWAPAMFQCRSSARTRKTREGTAGWRLSTPEAAVCTSRAHPCSPRAFCGELQSGIKAVHAFADTDHMASSGNTGLRTFSNFSLP